MPETERVRLTFAELIADIAGGRFSAEAAEGLRELAAAVMKERRSGAIQILIGLSPEAENQVYVTYDINVKAPKPAKPRSIMFVTDNNDLSRRDPNQPDLPLSGGRRDNIRAIEGRVVVNERE